MTIEKIITDFKQELFGFVHKRIKDEDKAKDVHQEILIKIFTNHKSLKNQSSLKSWMFQIARNAITDYFRKNKFIETELSDNIISSDSEPIEEDELLPCITPFLQQLRPNHKRALELTDLGDLSQKELAEKMNLSYSGAKSTVQRARQEVRKIFDQCCKIETDRYGSVLSVTPSSRCGCS